MSDFVIGDLHGHLNDYRRLLGRAGLIDDDDRWCGGDHRLWLIGDLFDRGIHGIDCLELTMSLESQAREQGGEVITLLGNHEMMILCAYKFGDTLTSAGMPVRDQWLMWGGIEADLRRMTGRHAEWLARLPVMARHEDTLMIHADAMFYTEYGRRIDEVNCRFREIIEDGELHEWELALRAFCEHRAFSALGMTGQDRAEQMLRFFGARRIVHGHTPIPIATGQPAEAATQARTYAGGRCTNVDGGIYMGGPGFIHEL